MDPRQNLILAALPDEERRRLLRDSRIAPLVVGQTIYEQGESISEVYFPLSGAVSVLVLLENGDMMEPGIIGREGMLGFPVGLGDDTSRWRALVQLPGEAIVVSRRVLQDHLTQPGNLAPLLVHYASLLIGLVAQSAACSQFHPIRARCARWLLLMHDRAEGDDLAITHEFLAAMTGSQRPTITTLLGEWREEGIVVARRGNLHILDRAALESEVCECYRRVRIEYDQAVAVDARRSVGEGHPYESPE